MVQPALNARFFESTRGKLVDLLRRSSRTVDELAVELGITDNAVRLQLGVLERDGVVRSCGVRREGAVGKPATMSEIDPKADPSFSNAYLPFLSSAESASRALNELGGLTEIEPGETARSLRVRGYGCPLSTIVVEREEVCLAVQTMLGQLTGRDVREHCDRSGERPNCCFEIGG